MANYILATPRMYLKLAHPRMAREVADFNLRNREILQDVEPMRPSMFYTKRDRSSTCEWITRMLCAAANTAGFSH